MASTSFLKFTCALVVFMVVVAPHVDAALSCGTVTSSIAKCVSYLKGGDGPSDDCCKGVRTLNGLASTPADRKTACGCLKSAAGSIKGIDSQKAASLASDCGVSISYPISPNTDCSKVN